MGRGKLGDLFEEAERVSEIQSLAQVWAQEIWCLDQKISTRQREVAPGELLEREVAIRKPTFWDRVFKRKIPTKIRTINLPGKTSGIPGFDFSRHVWRRSFLIFDGSSVEVCLKYQNFLDIGEDPEAKVRDLACSFLADLESKRDQDTNKLSEEAEAVLSKFQNYSEHLERVDARDQWAKIEPESEQLDILRAAWTRRVSKTMMEGFHGDKELPGAILRYLPEVLVSTMGKILPPWSTEGSTWVTYLFQKIGVSLDEVEVPIEAFFEEVISRYPALGKRDTAFHFESDGYIPAAKMGRFAELIDKHKSALTMVHGSEDEESWSLIAEPVWYALENGLGLIETVR